MPIRHFARELRIVFGRDLYCPAGVRADAFSLNEQELQRASADRMPAGCGAYLQEGVTEKLAVGGKVADRVCGAFERASENRFHVSILDRIERAARLSPLNLL